MAVVSTAALICDTGALLDYIVKGAADHRRFRDAIDQARTRYLPGLVLAEVDYFLRAERPAMNAFMDDLARGAFTYAPPALDQLVRAMEIDRRYRLATRDIRHFATVRLRDGGAFELVVHPADPDRS